MRIKAYRRDERKVQIMAALAIKAQHGQQPKMTMYQLAKRLDMSPSTHLLNILKEMQSVGLLTCEREEHRSGIERLVWWLPGGSYQLPMEAAREIPIKKNGISQGVMSL